MRFYKETHIHDENKNKKHHHKHHKKHHGKGHHHVGSGSESTSSNTSSAPTSPSTSVSTTPRKPEGLASRQELNLLSSPTTPRSPSGTAIANPAAGKGESKGPLDARSLTRSPASAPLSPPFSASIRPLIGPALSPLMRPKRPEGTQQGERKGGEFYKVLAARCAAADVSSPSSSCTCPPPLRAHIGTCDENRLDVFDVCERSFCIYLKMTQLIKIIGFNEIMVSLSFSLSHFLSLSFLADDPPCYNQWGQRVNGFIGPLGSPGTTPVLSFTTPSPGEGKLRKTPRVRVPYLAFLWMYVCIMPTYIRMYACMSTHVCMYVCM
jgi:hypothetical protein